MTLSVTIQPFHCCAYVRVVAYVETYKIQGWYEIKTSLKQVHTLTHVDSQAQTHQRAQAWTEINARTHTGLMLCVRDSISRVFIIWDKEKRGREHYYTLHGTLIFLPNGRSHSCQQPASWPNKFCLILCQAWDGRRKMGLCMCVYSMYGCIWKRERGHRREDESRKVRKWTKKERN